MPMRSKLEAFYRATAYRVFLPTGALTLRIGQESPAVMAGYAPWAILTACNPNSQPLSNAENAQRQSALEGALLELGFEPYAGENVADDGQWPVEESCLVAGISVEQALALAGKFSQNAIVHCKAGQVPCLVWVESGAE